MDYDFAIELILNEPIEARVLQVINFIETKGDIERLIFFELEDTSNIGGQITDEISIHKEFRANLDQVFRVFKEGQVFELKLTIDYGQYCMLIIVRDGTHVNILGNDISMRSDEAVGPYKDLDISLFG